MRLFPELEHFCKARSAEYDLIALERQAELLRLSTYIKAKQQKGADCKLMVICTHNSRRSHMGQLFLALGAAHFGLSRIFTFSGGTEATAFNPRAVKSLQEIGFRFKTENAEADNPIYEVSWSSDQLTYQAYSTRFDEPPNPESDFAAIMVCNSADEACPFVAGSDFRIALPFEDPKIYDDMELESVMYTARALQIAREMFFVCENVKDKDKD